MFPASLGIHDTQTDNLLLIEATPAIDSQVAMLQEFAGISESRPVFDALMLTHAHMGHYAGLLQLGKEVAATETNPNVCDKTNGGVSYCKCALVTTHSRQEH